MAFKDHSFEEMQTQTATSRSTSDDEKPVVEHVQAEYGTFNRDSSRIAAERGHAATDQYSPVSSP
jgi:hypothetical protein